MDGLAIESRILGIETVEIYSLDFDGANDVKMAGQETFQCYRFGNKNSYMCFGFRVFYDEGEHLWNFHEEERRAAKAARKAAAKAAAKAAKANQSCAIQ